MKTQLKASIEVTATFNDEKIDIERLLAEAISKGLISYAYEQKIKLTDIKIEIDTVS